MSSALAMAAVTHVLKDLLNEGIVNSQLTGNVRVTAQPPIREPKPAGTEESQLNVFLYQVTPNPGWRNRGQPAFDSAGNRVASPPLAIDLHYLVTAYDERDLHAEVLLGYAMQLLHENPVLSRALIRRSLTRDLPASTGPSPPAPPSLPPELRALTKSGLADQFESIKVTPQTLDTEGMSKLWTGFQAPYRPSAAYLATVVLIESAAPARIPLPVLKLGEADRGPQVAPSLQSPFPTLLALRSSSFQPAAQVPGTVHLFGHHLQGPDVEVRLRHTTLDLPVRVAAAGLRFTAPPSREQIGADAETYDLPPDILDLAEQRVIVNLAGALPVANLAPGIYSLELLVSGPGDSQPRSTNALPLTLAPAILFEPATDRPVVTAAAPVNGFRATRIELKCRPNVHPGQRVSLVLGDLELPGEALFPGPGASTERLEFRSALPEAMFARIGTPPAAPRYPARLRVDGVESPFLRRFRRPQPPEFDPVQVIALP